LNVTFNVDGSEKTVTSDACKVKITTHKTPEVPVYTCDSLSAKLVSDNKYEFTGKATAKNGATVKNYTFDFGDNANTTVTNPNGVMHTYTAKDATYTATLNVTFNVDGSEKTVTSDACKVKITTHKTPEVPVYTCDALTAELVSDNTYKFNGKATAENGATVKNYKFDFGDNASQTVTNPVDVMHTYAVANDTYTANLYVTFNVDGKEKTVTSDACKVQITVSKPPVKECKPGIPEGDVRCTETPVTPVTPVTPSELPTTGAGADISAFFGLGSLVTSVGYYRASRRRG
jgi:mRNA-degrading endonuclease HigB of HigAB toxin-antitoxin module